MRKADGGWLTYQDIIAPCPENDRILERGCPTGTVEGIWQRSPQTQEYYYIPRAKTFYLVDDTLNDSPEGMGLFRMMVQASERLKTIRDDYRDLVTKVICGALPNSSTRLPN